MRLDKMDAWTRRRRIPIENPNDLSVESRLKVILAIEKVMRHRDTDKAMALASLLMVLSGSSMLLLVRGYPAMGAIPATSAVVLIVSMIRHVRTMLLGRALYRQAAEYLPDFTSMLESIDFAGSGKGIPMITSFYEDGCPFCQGREAARQKAPLHSCPVEQKTPAACDGFDRSLWFFGYRVGSQFPNAPLHPSPFLDENTWNTP